MSSGTYPLPPATVQDYARLGAVVLRGVLTPFEVTTLARGIEHNLAHLSPLALVASSGVGPASRRRVFSARYLGGDARHAVRNWRTSPSFTGLADRLPDGAVMEDALFPLFATK